MSALPGILEPLAMLQTFQKFDTAVSMPFGDLFATVPNTGPGNTVAIEVYEYGREVATINIRGADPHRVDRPTRTVQVAKAISLSESIPIPAGVIKDLRAPGEWQQANGEREVARCLLELRNRVDRRKALLQAQAVKNSLSFTLPGNIAETVSMGMSAYNAVTHPHGDASWATAGTDIVADLIYYKKLVAQRAGVNLTRMFLNSNTAKYLFDNTALAAYWQASPAAMNIAVTGQLPPIWGIQPVIVDDGYDASGTFTDYMPDNAVVLAPSAADSPAQIVECEPQSLLAPAGYKGLFFHTKAPEGGNANINDGYEIQFQYDFLPTLGANPDALVYIADVTATS